MADMAAACKECLDSLTAESAVKGAILTRRDGLPVMQSWPLPSDVDTLAAMGAALLGAGEAALREFGRESPESILVVSEGIRISVLAIDADHALLVAMDRETPIESLDTVLRHSLETLRESLGG
jgi:predicted regulator of Ras-like GTPase activity (Roadblock/LC7/MglB family)